MPSNTSFLWASFFASIDIIRPILGILAAGFSSNPAPSTQAVARAAR